MNTQTDDDVLDTETETEITDDDALDPNADRGDNFTATTPAAPVAPVAPVAPAAAPTETDDDDAPARMIPKGRFDEVNNAKKAAELENARLLAEIDALRKGGEPAATVAAPVTAKSVQAASPEIAELEDQYNDALMDGDKDKARELRMEINDIVGSNAMARALQAIKQESSDAAIAQAIGTAANAVIGKYPAFDDSHADANQEAIEELVELRDYYIEKKGMSPAEAIIQAGDKVAKLFGFADGPAVVAPPVTDPRTAAAIKRGAAITDSQPSTAAVGVGTRVDGGTVNIADMTEEQFDALPEAEKRRARGD